MLSKSRMVMLLVSAAIAASLSGCTMPPGYQHDTQSIWPWEKLWVPGSTYPDHPHIHADASEGAWDADLGYQFVAGTTTYEVHWQEGLADPNHPHIHSSNVEGRWQPDLGYAWISKENNDLKVVWTPYLTHPKFEHVYSYTDEGTWMAMPGYKFKATDTEISSSSDTLEAIWNPGVQHPSCPLLIASDTEGRWNLANGYILDDNNPRHLMFHKDPEVASQEKWQHFWLALGGAFLANAVGQPSKDDSEFGAAVKSGARDVRDHLTVDALTTAFKQDDAGNGICDMQSTVWTRSFRK